MTKKHYVVEGEGKDRHLVDTEGGAEFAADGTKILRIVMANGDEHLINFGDHERSLSRQDGVLSIDIPSGTGSWLRSYRDWSYYEVVPYAVPAPIEATIF